MKRQSIPLPAICAAAFSFASFFAAATAHASGAPTVQAADAWVRWLPNKLPAAGYVTLTNNGDKPVDLTMTSSPDYGSVMLHQTISNGSTSQMVMVEKATVPAHGALKVAPGGYHFMLEDATHKIAPGGTVHLRMQFSDGTTLDTPFIVKSPAQAK
ncbi:copper chaperone PCu(A)C [Trinickia sp. LjRoot230]|uniref:copper chaperone PCu(A)C n=1 Tax=Trinickia sp. LjRoot230 TaxID=3342288 RepID=UPI003ECE0A30